MAATPQASPKSAGSSRQKIRARENAASSSAAHRLSETAPATELSRTPALLPNALKRAVPEIKISLFCASRTSALSASSFAFGANLAVAR